jgi:Xaa-Pro aminopeptidase
MRRGLISWSRAELPEMVLDARVARLQAAMAQAKLDAVVAYTIPARTAAVSWLTGFVPYWNEGVAVVPLKGRPVLISALSNRVKDWIERNAHVERVLSNPRIGVEAASIVSTAKPKAVIGVIDLPRLPAGLIEALAASGHELRDASAVFASVRTAVDPAELALAARAAGIAAQAFGCADADAEERDAGRLIGLMEGEARRLGAEEVYPAVAADLHKSLHLVRAEGAVRLGDVSAIRLSVAYKGVWVRVTRTRFFGANGRDRLAAAEVAFAAAIAGLPDRRALAGAQGWLVEGTRCSTPLEPLAGSKVPDGLDLQPGELVSVQATFAIEGQPVLVGAPVLIGASGMLSSQILPPRLL